MSPLGAPSPRVSSDSGPGIGDRSNVTLPAASAAAPTLPPGGQTEVPRGDRTAGGHIPQGSPPRGQGALDAPHRQCRGTDRGPTRSRCHDSPAASLLPGMTPSHHLLPRAARRQGWDQVPLPSSAAPGQGPQPPALRGGCSGYSLYLPASNPLSRLSPTKPPEAQGPLQCPPL